MITSVVLTDKHKINLDRYNKFMLGENKISIKDVPFVRYRFDKYNEEDIQYIKDMKKIFIYSSHMIEILLGEDTTDVINAIDNNLPYTIRFVYIPIDDGDISNGIKDSKLEQLNNISELFIDRLMIKDIGSKLDAITANRIKKQFADVINTDAGDIGVCSSPLSFTGDNACLTALRARELSAEYAEHDEVALPTANHECMNTCGCIRYAVISEDTPIMEGGQKESSVKSSKRSVRGIPKW